jgi:hypothetical protein
MRPVRAVCDVSRLIANRRASFRGNPPLICRDETPENSEGTYGIFPPRTTLISRAAGYETVRRKS